MTVVLHNCPKCDGSMEQGFVVDLGYSGDMFFGERYVSRWSPGLPQKSLFSRTKRVKTWLPMGTYRCTACGYLESYARPEFASKSQTQFSLRSLFIVMTIVAVVLGLLVFLAGDIELR